MKYLDSSLLILLIWLSLALILVITERLVEHTTQIRELQAQVVTLTQQMETKK